MIRSYAIAAALAIVPGLSSPASAQAQKTGWSLGYYCGWDQGGYAPSQINWKAFTHIAHFTIFPNNDGSLDVTTNGLSDANCKAAVAEAHKNGVKIVICFGGAKVADRFKSACAPENIHRFVKNMLDFMRLYGYDGIDTDWEENFDDAKFLAWHKEIRDSLDKISPRPLFTIAGGGYFASHCASAGPYVDMMNTMSYDVNLNGMTGEMKEFTSRGVPKQKLGVGIGIGSGGSMVDVDSATAKGKVLFAINNGFGGIMQWAVKGTTRHVPIFKMLEQYIPERTSVVFDNGKLRVVNDPSLRVLRNTITGMDEIRYTVSPALGGLAETVNLSLLAPNGVTVKQLIRGRSHAGTFTVPVDAGAGVPLRTGAYVVKLSTGTEVKTARLTIVR